MPDLRQPQCQRAGRRGEVEQVRRAQQVALVAQQLLGEVGLKPLLEQGEPRARTDVGTESHAYAVRDVAGEREEAAAERGVAGRAVADRRTAGGEQLQL